MRLFLLAATFWGLCLSPGLALQIQCYQCEEFQLNNDCSSPEFIVNCTVNVQDMCQKEVMEKSFAHGDCQEKCSYGILKIESKFTFLEDQVYLDLDTQGHLDLDTFVSGKRRWWKAASHFRCEDGIMYRKSCASSAACLIASAGYQSFCSPGKVNSVCISCCNTPLCNGPRPKKRGNSGVVPRAQVITTVLLLKFTLLFFYC